MSITPVGTFRPKWFNVEDSVSSSMIHSTQSCVVKVRCNGETITSWFLSFCDCDCECSCNTYAISSVYLFLVKPAGLVHVKNKHHALKLVFVLLHISSSSPCQHWFPHRCLRRGTTYDQPNVWPYVPPKHSTTVQIAYSTEGMSAFMHVFAVMSELYGQNRALSVQGS